MSALYHYTCDHGAELIEREGHVKSLYDVLGGDEGDGNALMNIPQSHFGWFTDLAEPNREALGLTSITLGCDRTAHRFRVTDATEVTWWLDVRRYHPILWHLEEADGAMPAHWWLATEPVPAVRS